MTFQDFFNYINRNQMLPTFCGIEPKGGFNQRLAGKDTQGKPSKGLTKQDKILLKEGMKKYAEEINQLADSIDIEDDK